MGKPEGWDVQTIKGYLESLGVEFSRQDSSDLGRIASMITRSVGMDVEKSGSKTSPAHYPVWILEEAYKKFTS